MKSLQIGDWVEFKAATVCIQLPSMPSIQPPVVLVSEQRVRGTHYKPSVVHYFETY